jgi:competence ComEA-like helix-hairpin-helix protein
MSENIKDYFYFTKREKNGIMVLLVILITLIVFPYIYSTFKKSTKTESTFQKEIEGFVLSLHEVEEPSHKNRLDQYIINRYDSIDLFFFNPNTTNDLNYKKLGFTDKQIGTIRNYLQKGGRFYIKDDFRKIYGIRHQQYEIVKPYLLLPDEKPEWGGTTKHNNQSENETRQPTLFVFDPNKASDEDFTDLGLSEQNIKTIRNYLLKIGSFRTKEDFKKIYGISEEKYNQLEPYIFIEKKEEKVKITKQIEINTASVEELEALKGIGKFTAEEIIKYREKLGGYYSTSQLLEIKAIKPDKYEQFKDGLIADKSKIKPIRLNFADISELVSHPYINYHQAKEIVSYRSKNGAFTSKNQLVQNKLFLEQSFQKIEYYLTLD